MKSDMVEESIYGQINTINFRLSTLSLALITTLGIVPMSIAAPVTPSVPGEACVTNDNGQLACGEGAYAGGTNSISIGKDANNPSNLYGKGKNNPDQLNDDNSIAIGNRTLSYGNNNIVVGQEAQAGYGISYNRSYEHNIAIGTSAEASNEKGIAIGYDSYIGTDATSGIAIGERATVGRNASRSISIGQAAVSQHIDNIVLGTSSKAVSARGIAIGWNAQNQGGADGITLGSRATILGGHQSTVIGVGARANGVNSISIGSNTYLLGNSNIALGWRAKAGTDTGQSSQGLISIGQAAYAERWHSIAIGSGSSTGSNSSDGIAIGHNARVLQNSSIALGRDATASSLDNIIFGRNSRASEASAIAIGLAAQSAALSGIALGSGASTLSQAKGAVALGSGSVADRGGFISGVRGTDENSDFSQRTVYSLALAEDVDKNNIKNTVKGTLGAISVGETDSSTRQIINVAAGSIDTDAVNVAQLKAVANTPMRYSGDVLAPSSGTNNTFTRKLGQETKIVGGITDTNDLSDNNIGVVSNGEDTLTIKLAKNIKDLDSITIKDVAIDSNGINAGDKKVTGVADGAISDASTDAINGSQLFNTVNTINDNINSAKTEVESGKNITVDTKRGSNGQTIYTVNTADEVDFNKVTVGKVAIDNTGINAGDEKVTGVADGDISSTSTDAINGSQLYNQGNNVAKIIGGNATISPNGGDITVTNIGGTGADTINDAIAAVNKTAKASKIEVADGKNITVTPGLGNNGQTIYTVATKDEVDFNKVTVGKVAIDNKGINAGDEKVTGVADGDISSTSKDAINGSQLHNTAQSVANALGGGSQVNDEGKVTAPSYKLEGTGGDNETVSNIGGALNFFTSQIVKPITFAGTEGSHTAQLGDTVNIIGANSNITTSVEDNNVKIRLADDLNIKSVTTGNTKVDNDGVTIKSAKGDVSLTANGLNNGGNPITNVAPGVADNDVATFGQVKGVAQQVNRNTQAINQLGNRVDDIDRKLKGGIAGNSAMASLPQAYLPGHSMVAIAGGHYSGKSAIALGVSRISDSGHVVIKLNAATNSAGGTNVGAGIGYQW